MKYLIYVVFISVSVLLGCTKVVENDLTELGIKGRVKSIRQKSGIPVEKFGETVIDINNGYPSDIYILFNKRGKRIEEINYDVDGKVLGKKSYGLDKKGNVIKESIFYEDGSSEIVDPYKYDDFGNLIEMNDGNDTFTYKYDSKGKCIESNEMDINNKPDEKITYKYDEKGRILEEDHFNYSGIGLDYYKYKYKYQNTNIDVERHMYDSDGNLIDKIVQVWSENGTIKEPIKYLDYDDDFKFSLDKYYKTGTKIEILRFDVTEGKVEVEPMEHIIEEFDDKGNIINYIEDDHKPNRIEYVYDRQGNWTRMLMYDGDDIMKLSLREIVYF